MGRHVLVTRPRADAEPLAVLLRDRGLTVTVEPLIDIAFEKVPPLDLSGVAALLFTSANGVRAVRAALDRAGATVRDKVWTVPVHAVGDASARAARHAGFTSVTSAVGDVSDLADLAARARTPQEGALLHIAGSHVAGDLSGLLKARGFDVRRTVLYRQVRVDSFSEAVGAGLAQGRYSDAVFFSPRTASTFAKLAHTLPEAPCRPGLNVVCLSHAVADALGDLPVASLSIAPAPTQDALVETLLNPGTDPGMEPGRTSP